MEALFIKVPNWINYTETNRAEKQIMVYTQNGMIHSKKKKKNELTTTWMNLNTVLNERSQTRPKTTPNKQTKKTYCTIPFI